MSGPEYDDPNASFRNGACDYCGKALAPYHRTENGKEYCSIKCMEADRLVKDISDGVISPPHYTHGGIETIDFIKAKLTPDEFRGYLKGSVIKYLSRANLKGNEDQDYGKASFYASMLAGDDPRKEAE